MQRKWSLRLKGGVKEMEPNLGKCEWWVGKEAIFKVTVLLFIIREIESWEIRLFDIYRIGCHWNENVTVRMVAACYFEISELTYKTTPCHNPEGQNLNSNRLKNLKTNLPDKRGRTKQETHRCECNLNVPAFLCVKQSFFTVTSWMYLVYVRLVLSSVRILDMTS